MTDEVESALAFWERMLEQIDPSGLGFAGHDSKLVNMIHDRDRAVWNAAIIAARRAIFDEMGSDWGDWTQRRLGKLLKPEVYK